MEVRYGNVVWLRTRQHGEYEVIATSIPAEERRGEERRGEERRGEERRGEERRGEERRGEERRGEERGGEGRRGEEMEVSNTHRQFIDSVYQSQ